MELNSLNPYNICSKGEWYYEFDTKRGIKYHLYFIEASSYDFKVDEVYIFNIERDGDEPQPYDKRISQTIISLLDKFFENRKRAIVIVCDSSDGKEKKRNNLFKRWFDIYHRVSLLKIDEHSETEDYNIYASLFILKDNPNRDEIITKFKNLADNNFIPD